MCRSRRWLLGTSGQSVDQPFFSDLCIISPNPGILFWGGHADGPTLPSKSSAFTWFLRLQSRGSGSGIPLCWARVPVSSVSLSFFLTTGWTLFIQPPLPRPRLSFPRCAVQNPIMDELHVISAKASKMGHSPAVGLA